ncbi:glycosyltransferase [Sphingobium ummariense]
MRIVIDLQPCQNGSRHRGIGRYSLSLAKAMVGADRNHDYIIALNRSFPDSIDVVRRSFDGLLPPSAFVTYSVPPMATSADPLNAWRNRAAELVRAHFLESLSPDVVFIPSLFEGFWDDTVVSVEKGAPYLTAVTLHDLIPLEDPVRYLGGEQDRAAYFRRLNDARRADLLLAVSRYAADDAIVRLGLPANQVVVAYGGVGEEFRAPRKNAAEKAALLAKYGIERPYVMAASPLEPRKNLEGLIAGFASMAKELHHTYQLALAGKMDAYARKYLGDLAEAEGLPPGAVVFPGFVADEDLPALYHHSRVFAFPSYSEGFGLPLLEAMACGAPVVGSSKTSIPEVLGRRDLMCDPANAVEIGQTIERILTQPDLERELREFGPRRAAEFSWARSAATALDAIEDLHRRKTSLAHSRAKTAAMVQAGKGSLALVLAAVPPEHRLAGFNNALAAAVADRFDVTIITAGDASISDWLKANCSIRHVDWFDAHADDFHDILYGTDYMADAAFRRLMRRHPGSLILAERLSNAPAGMLTGRRLSDGVELAVLDAAGLGGLVRAAADEYTPAQMIDLLMEDMGSRADDLYLEADSRMTRHAGRVGIVPIETSPRARAPFLQRIGVADGQTILAAIGQDEDAATALIQNFRIAFAGRDEKPVLVVHCARPTSSDAVKVTRLVSDIIKIEGDLDSIYCGLLSSADMLVVDERLPDPIRTRLRIDFPDERLLAGGALDPSSLAEMFAAFGCRGESARPDITGSAKVRAVGLAIADGLARRARPTGDGLIRQFVAGLPAEVRGRRPDSNDLAKVAECLARNEASERSPQIYVDLSAFAKPNPTHRIDRVTRDWLQALFRVAGPEIRAVYADGDNFVVANQFASYLCGVSTSCLKDRVLKPRLGDRIIGSDLFHSFANGSFEALARAHNDGVALGYIVMDDFAFQREAQIRPFAAVLRAWMEEASLSNHAVFTGLPRSKADIPFGAASQDRVLALAEADIPLTILSCPDLLGDTAAKQGKGRVSPPLSQAIAAWRAARLAPPAAARIVNAADLGHVVAGHMLGSYSLAIINRMLAKTLEASFPGGTRYIPIETVPIRHTEGVPAEDKPLMIELSAREAPDHGDEVVISHHYPVIVPEGSYRLTMGLFFWEESAVPDHTIQLLAKNFDAIISPARTVTNALLDSGLPIPIATIGQPVDIDRYVALASARKPRGATLRFLHVSSCFKRKGVDVLLEAWGRAFTSADPVRLVIKTFPNPHNDVEEQLAGLQARYPDLAEIEIVNRDVEQDELLQFYADADVMVLPSRGEGYNLPALEAMASGLPLIVTGHGGQRDFCSDREARLIRYHFASSESHVSGHHSLWVEPDVDDLAAALREQVDPTKAAVIEERRQRALIAATRESDKMAWLHRYAAMVESLISDADHEKARVAWISTWGVQCGIAQYSHYLIDHFSEAAQRKLTVICDHRTDPRFKSVAKFVPAWPVHNVPKVDQILDAANAADAEAIVIQHQDGLLSWDQLGRLAHDDRLAGKASIVILHNAGNMVRASSEEVATLLEGLGRFSRVLVHNIADMNFLMSMGLKHNVGLLPHGAFARDQAPWPKRLGSQDAPIIGCHGFFFQHKGIDRLIRAAAKLKKEWPNLKLRLVNARFPGEGNDVYVQECRALAKSLGIFESIEWYQDFMPIEQINDLLAGCDIIALPYSESSDSASGAVRVSLSSMVPLVATRVKIFAELGDAAAWADNNDPDVLAEVIGSLLRSPEKRRTVQAAMHEWLNAHDWTRVAGILEGMIQGLVQEKRLHWDYRRNEL